MTYSGYVQCFCDEKAEEGALSSAEYGPQSQPICQEYIDSILPTLIASNSVTVIITVINIIIREVTIKLITWIGYDTHSELVTNITNGVFIAQFFNTAILILLVYANFTEFGGTMLQGPFYDYQPAWYSVVGYKIVQTMAINAFMPIFVECTPIVVKWLQ